MIFCIPAAPVGAGHHGHFAAQTVATTTKGLWPIFFACRLVTPVGAQGPLPAVIVRQPDYGSYEVSIVLAAAHAHTLPAQHRWHRKRISCINYYLMLTLPKYYFTVG